MDFQPVAEQKNKRPTRTIIEQSALAVAFGFFGYIILFFISVSLILPSVLQNETVVALFWPITISLLFAIEIWCAYAMLKPIKDAAVKSSFLVAAAIVVAIIAASPLLFADDSVRSSIFNFALLLIAPFLGNIVGGWFVSRRA